ncbi:MAG: calcium/sodium antiporter [Phycisphaerae bacterium]|nr:calcium/sodium antiporter [Phycisphaerae bacterium]
MISFLLIAGGLVILYFGAEILVKGSVAMAEHLGINSLAIGLTVVAFGTSAPELTVSAYSAMKDAGDIAVANVVGSNIFNIAFILGLSAIICPVNISISLIKKDIPAMLIFTTLAIYFLSNRFLSRLEGCLLLTLAIIYTIYTLRQSRLQTKPDPTPTSKPKKMYYSGGYVLSGLILLAIGSKMLITGSIDLAQSLGISQTLIGLTIVSAGTSLPELATSVIAAWKRQPDIAVGNIIGSNIFNILGILGISSILSPLRFPDLASQDLIMLALMSLLALPLMRSNFEFSRLEGSLMLTLYAFYLYLLWP